MTKVLHSIATRTHAAAKKASDRELLNDRQARILGSVPDVAAMDTPLAATLRVML
jgi:hypothetical protein